MQLYMMFIVMCFKVRSVQSSTIEDHGTGRGRACHKLGTNEQRKTVTMLS